ncbi:MAG TPA: zf-HC2 domain-containing protein [Streptosporangiaceae bacterium]
MTSAWECGDTRQALGVYVLGAIDPAERSLVDAHISGCAECRDELAGLAGLPALLARVGADEVGRISQEDAGPPPPGEAPPDDFVGSLVSLTAARRRRARRWQMVAAAAAVVLAAGGSAAGLRLASGTSTSPASAEPAPPASWQTARTTSVMKGVDATIRYQKLPWGVAYDVQITGVPAGTTCQLWVTDGQNVHLLAAGWTVSSHDLQAWYPGSSWVPKGQVRGMDVTAGNEQLATFITG